MIEGIKEIGEKILSNSPEEFLESLTLNVPSKKQGRKQYIVIIEFDISKETINFDFEEIKEDTPKKYLWVDVAKGNKPQIYLTTSGRKKFTYLFTKTLSEIKKYKYPYHDKEVQNFRKLIDKVYQKFFNNKGHIDIKKFSCDGEFLVNKIASRLGKEFSQAVNELKSSKTQAQKKEIIKKLFGKDSNCKKYLPQEKFKSLRDRVEELVKKDLNPNIIFLPKEESKKWVEEKFSKDIEKMSKENTDESKLSVIKAMSEEKLPEYEDIQLIGVRILDKNYSGNLVDLPGYRKMLEYEKIGQVFDDKHGKREYKEKISEGICNLCGNLNKVSSNMTNLGFKFYMTDKIGFSGRLKGKFLENYVLCKDCYKKLLVGESFVKNNLGSRLAGTTFYIIPKFIFDTPLSIDKLKKWAEYINVSFKSTTSLEGLKMFQEKIKNYPNFEEQKNNFILNFLFYRKAQSEFKILKLIKDVPPTRLNILRNKEIEVHDIANKILGENDRWYLNLGRMYYLFPVRISNQNVVDHKKVLEFYDSLFSEKPVSYKFLIEQFVELACVYKFEKFDNYNIGKPDNSDIGLVYAMIEANLLLLYLKRLNLLEGGETMGEEINALLLPEEMKEYFNEMGYSESKIALFLLGYLIGEIGNAQIKSGNTKPILNKITYQGMNAGKILRLVNEVFEKLKQYDRLSFNEGVFGEMKKLLDKYIENWKLSDQENVFYVLSGYAYNTYRALIGSNKKEKGQKEEVENE